MKYEIARVWILVGLCTLGANSTIAPFRAQSTPGSKSPPNILLILTDDQRWDTIAALGNPAIRTSNLDRLVARGFTFNNAYCMGSMIGAVCLPSRTMLITGRSTMCIIPELHAPGKNPAGSTANQLCSVGKLC